MASLRCPNCDAFFNHLQLKDDNCWSCGNDISILKKDKKTNSSVDKIEKNQNSKEKNFTNEGDKIIKQKTDYPVMQALAKYFNFIAILNAIGGVFIAVFSLINGEIVFFFAGLILGGIFWAISKFFSELMKISSDIADNVKAIRHSLEK
tara:strand:- start:42 stop:488 length:447 start_codon:yes stop_codon:yes gene_type:complete